MPASVAVLIVNFHVYDGLERALSSLGGAEDVVVFDQASEAAAAARVRALHPAVRWITSEQNVGFAAGVNRAAGLTTARYLLLLNPDAVVGDGAVAALAGWLDAHPDCGIVGPRVLDPDGAVQASARRFPNALTAIAGRSTWLSRRFPNNWLTSRNLVAREATAPTRVDWLAGSCVMIRRELFDRLGGFDERFFLYWEDTDLAWRARSLGYHCTYLPTVRVHHVGGQSAHHAPERSIREFHRSAYLYFVKTTGLTGRLYAPAVWLALRLRAEWRVWWFVRRRGADWSQPARRRPTSS